MEDLDFLKQSHGPKVDPLKYPTEKCEKCGGIVYKNGYIFKKIPGLEIGNGTEDVQYPVPVFVCNTCGELCKADKELLEKYEVQEEKKPSLILDV